MEIKNIMSERMISECKNKHFFVGGLCPWCRESVVKTHPYYEGDCVGCGALCANGVYCCTDKDPMNAADFDSILAYKERNFVSNDQN